MKTIEVEARDHERGKEEITRVRESSQTGQSGRGDGIVWRREDINQRFDEGREMQMFVRESHEDAVEDRVK